MILRGSFILFFALWWPGSLRAAGSSADTLRVLELLREARQPAYDTPLGFAYDSALSAQALALAERIGWERGRFKGHLWSFLSFAAQSYRPSEAEWGRHISETTQRRRWASDEELVLLYRLLSRRSMGRGEEQAGYAYLDTAQQAADRSGDRYLLALMAYSRAHTLRLSERWAEAFREVLVANTMAEEVQDPHLMSAGYRLSGMIRGRLGDTENSVKDFRAALVIADSLGMHNARAGIHLNWAYVMQVQGNWREALDHYRTLCGIVATTNVPMTKGLLEYQMGVGHMLVHLDSLDQAELILGRLKRTNAMVGNPYEPEFNTAWALLQLRRGHYHEAVTYAHTAFVTEQRDENDVRKRDASRILAEAYKGLNEPAKALEWTEVAHQWTDSVLYRQQAAAAIKATFDQELQREQATYALERDRSMAAMENVRMQRVILLVVSLLILVIAGLLVNRYRLRRRLQVARLRSSLSRDLHDDIGSTLSSISILSNVAAKKAEAGNVAEAAASFAKISGRSQRLMRDMSDIVWSVDPQKDSLTDLLARMRAFATAVLEDAGVDHLVDFPSDVPGISLPMETRQNIYLIFKEAMNNVVKHAGATHVVVRVAVENGMMRMEVRDDGAGMDPEAPTNGHGGNGLRNMRQRAAEMHAELRIGSAMGTGTVVRLELPLRA